MRWRKRAKSIDDVSVSKLLDEFVDLDDEDDSKRKEMDDDEYIRMMVEKEEKRKLERTKRTPVSSTSDDVETTPAEPVKKATQKTAEPMEEEFPPTCEHDLSPEDEADIDEIMKTQDRIEASVLTGKMKASVKFLQDEVKSSESKRVVRKTLEKYRKEIPVSTKNEVAPIISEKQTPLKRCQTCYFCVKEKKASGSCWCQCTNPARSTHAVAKGSWVKSRMNLPCWKAPQD
ncbi:MAG: hypothetical protein ACTSPB_18010 [Candidatus Thorarchaeota archaeon]